MRREARMDGIRVEWMSENWRPQLPFQLWPSRTPTPVKINVTSYTVVSLLTVLITWRSPHPFAIVVHLKIHVRLYAESKALTKRGPAFRNSQTSPEVFRILRTTRARRCFSFSREMRARYLSGTIRKINFDSKEHKNNS